MEEHLGKDKYRRQDSIDKSYRNGYSSKNIRTSFGDIQVDIPRDRKSEFEPRIVKKYETVCNEFDKKVIGLYAGGCPWTISNQRLMSYMALTFRLQ